MKKTLFILVSLIVLVFISYTLFNPVGNTTPKYSTTTSRNVQILKIHQNELETRIDFKVEAVRYKRKGFTISSKNTYIQDSKGGKKIHVLRADSIQMDKVYLDTVFENIRYTLVFPPLNKTIELIDFIGKNTKIFDIELVPQQYSSVLPEDIKGNWLKSDGSNKWDYGFYDDVIIYKNKFWNKFSLKKEGSSFVLELEKDGDKEQIYIETSKDNQLLIGDNLENLKLYGKEKKSVKNYVIKNNKKSDTIIFKEGAATYKGYIKGYHKKMNWEIKVHVPNVIINEYTSYVFPVNEDGTFHAEIPMNYAEKAFIWIGDISENVYLEPGKTTMQFIDLEEHNAPYKTITERIIHKRKALFMGGLARLNAEMKSLEHLRFRKESNYGKSILGMSAVQYKEYYLDIMKKEQDSLKAFVQKNSISQRAQKIKEMEISLRASSAILSYDLNISGAERMWGEKNKEGKEFKKTKKLVYKEEIKPDYYDFLNLDKLDNSASLITGAEYYFFINRLRMGTQLMQMGVFVDYFKILKSNINKRGIVLTAKEKVMLDALVKCKKSADYGRITRKEGHPWRSFNDKYDDIIVESRSSYMDERRKKERNRLFGKLNKFEKEIILGQNKSSYIKRNYVPFNKWILEELEDNISNNNIKNVLLKYSNITALKKSENLEGKDYFIHKTPQVKVVNLLEAILSKHKGKVILVDFWATWCGPCLKGMDRVKYFKEKFKDEDLEFVYITNFTSPLKTYEAAIPGIKGNHYRLENKQWEYLQNLFLIKGIPQYLFVDKEGNIIRDDLHFPFISGEFEKLINQYL